MRVVFGQKRKFLYEYSFYQAIREFNDSAEAAGKSPILTTEARRLHAEVLDRISKTSFSPRAELNNVARANVSMTGGRPENVLLPDEFAGIVNDVLGERMGQLPYADGDIPKAHSDEFVRVTGMAEGVRDVSGAEYRIPISPFDERFAERETVWSNGSALLWAKVDEIQRVKGVSTLSQLAMTPEQLEIDSRNKEGVVYNAGNLNMYTKVYREVETDTGAKLEDVGRLMTLSDISGVALLRPYILSAENYEAAASSANIPFDQFLSGRSQVFVSSRETTDGQANREVPMAEAVREARRCARAGAAVLAEQMRSGRPTTVRAARDGQVEILDEVSRMVMRVLDEPDQIEYAGRIMDSNASTFYLPRLSRTVAKGERGASGYRSAPMRRDFYTPELAVNMFKWACGRPAEMANGAPMGQVQQFLADSRRNRNDVHHGSYYSANSTIAVAIGEDNFTANNGATERVLVRLHADYGKAPARQTLMSNPDTARETLLDGIVDAKNTFLADVDVFGLFDEYEEFGSIEDYRPDFERGGMISDEAADVRATIWDILSNPDMTIINPRVDKDELESIEDVMDAAIDIDGNMVPRDRAISYISEYMDEYIGRVPTEDEGIDAITMDLNGLARYAPTGSEQDARDQMLAAMRTLGYKSDHLTGTSRNSRIGDSLRTFNDERTSEDDMSLVRTLSEMPQGTQRRAMETVRDALRRNMCSIDDDDILIDNHGIIRYNAWRSTSAQMPSDALMRDAYERPSVDGRPAERKRAGAFPEKLIEGTIGPVFEKTYRGSYATDFAASENYEAIPHTIGYAAPSEDGIDIFSRLRGYSFEDRLMDRISAVVSSDIRRAKDGWLYTGRADSLLREWRESDYLGKMPDEETRYDHARHMDVDMDEFRLYDDARVATECLRVSFGSEISSESSVVSDLQNRRRNDPGDKYNDNGGDVYRHYGSMDWSTVDERFDAFFSVDRAASAGSHSHTRYMRMPGVLSTDKPPVAVGTQVDVPLFDANLDLFNYASYDAWNRRQIAGQNAIDSYCITKPVQTAYCTFGNWVDEDAIPVSKEFAERYQVPVKGKQGVYRPLGPGDKLSDLHGNKGVVSIVVDRDMDDKVAEELGILEEVQFFRANPSLDLIMNPAATESRFNAGTLREALDRPGKNSLHNAAGEVPNGIVNVRFCIQDKTAEKKTGMDKDNAKFGWQEMIVGYSLGISAYRDEAVDEGKMEARVRDMVSEVLTCGYGISVVGNEFGSAFDDDSRARILDPDDTDLLDGAIGRKKDGNFAQVDGDKRKLVSQFANMLERHGGEMELPFALSMPVYAKRLTRLPDGVSETSPYVTPITMKRKDKEYTVYDIAIGGEEIPSNGTGSYLLPVASRSLREGFFKDATGEQVHSNITGYYTRIYSNALDWKIADAREQAILNGRDFESLDKGSDDYKRASEQRRVKNKAVSKASGELNGLSQKMTVNFLDGKHNLAKDGAYAGKLRDATAAIWSPDPRLKFGEVGISPALAKKMNVVDGNIVTVRRHPVLKGGNVLGLRVKVDERLIGVSVHPGLATMYAGDFDGDQVVIHSPRTVEARLEARDVYNYTEFLADTSSSLTDEGRYKLNIGLGGDTAVSLADRPELQQQLEEIEKAVTDYHDKRYLSDMTNADGEDLSELSDEDRRNLARGDIRGKFTKLLRDARAGQYGFAAIDFTNSETCMVSLYEEVVKRGVKGSPEKMRNDLAKAVGVEYEYTSDGEHIDLDTFVDYGHTLYTRADDADNMTATVAKQRYTGLPGKEMQRMGAAFADDPEALNSGLHITEKLYQNTLDWKQSGRKAREQMPYIDCAKSILGGYVVDKDPTKYGQVLLDDEGNPMRATKEQFVEQLAWCMTEKLEQDINLHDVEVIGDRLSAASDDEYVTSLRTLVDRADVLTRTAFKESADELFEGILAGERFFSGPYFDTYADVPSRAELKFAPAEGESFDLPDAKRAHKLLDAYEGGVDTTKRHTPMMVKPVEDLLEMQETNEVVAEANAQVGSNDAAPVYSMRDAFARPKKSKPKPPPSQSDGDSDEIAEKYSASQELC